MGAEGCKVLRVVEREWDEYVEYSSRVSWATMLEQLLCFCVKLSSTYSLISKFSCASRERAARDILRIRRRVELGIARSALRVKHERFSDRKSGKNVVNLESELRQ